MREFKFNGDWETELHLDKLAMLQNDKFYDGKYLKKIKERLLQGLVEMRIFDSISTDPDPTTEQLSTIKFIQENEESLLNSIYNRIAFIEYPILKKLIDDEEWNFPRLSSVEDLEQVLGLESITILEKSKEQYSYFSINFNCSWDYEHGFHLLFHKNKVLNSGQAGSFDLELVCKDSGLEYEKDIKDCNHWDDEIFEFIKPNPKYGKLKPKELRSNQSLPFRLIDRGKGELLISYIQQGTIDIDYGFVKGQSSNSLLANAVYAQDEALVDYLIENGIKNFLHSLQALQRIENENISKKVESYYSLNKEKLWLTSV